MAVTQADKAKQFRALHEAPGAFVIANVWDGGSARMMANLGFAALATSSGASAGTLGRRDGKTTRDEALSQARVICDATDLPVSADLEKGFGDTPEIVAETVMLAAQAGLVGCSIEDASGDPDAPIFELGPATERITAAVAAARALPFPFTLTGRAENYLRGRSDLADTIARLKSYEAAGADALMAPGLPDLESVRAVCAAVGKPFNFMVGIRDKSFTVAALAAAGVKRISLATSLYRAAMTGLLSAAKEVREHGTFGYIDTSLATPDMNAFLRG
jgi:2-methylisocitrate lyase-like PEP mutase family enzyme